MKKTLLLSVAASAIAFAGGDIAPVQPVQPQPSVAPAACDFWGQIGARYEFRKWSDSANKWGKDDNTWKTTVVLGVEKELGYGFGIGAEVAATSDLGLDIANPKYGEDAELSQLYLTYKYQNTAVKAGRQALPKSLSPWAWSDRTLGRLDTSFEGIVVVNTDIQDTTLVGAWIARAGDKANFNPVNGVNNKGLFMLTAQYKGIANTTLTGSAYYVPKASPNEAMYSFWGTAETKVDNFDLGLQAVYAKTKDSKETTGVAAYAGTTYEGLEAKLTLAYLKSGATSINLGGTSAFWGDSFAGAFGGDILEVNSKQKIARIDLGYKIEGYGKVYGGVAYDKVSDSATDKILGARVGYKFNVNKIAAKVEYRYVKTTPTSGSDIKHQRVRIEGVYKF